MSKCEPNENKTKHKKNQTAIKAKCLKAKIKIIE